MQGVNQHLMSLWGVGFSCNISLKIAVALFAQWTSYNWFKPVWSIPYLLHGLVLSSSVQFFQGMKKLWTSSGSGPSSFGVKNRTGPDLKALAAAASSNRQNIWEYHGATTHCHWQWSFQKHDPVSIHTRIHRVDGVNIPAASPSSAPSPAQDHCTLASPVQLQPDNYCTNR